MKGDPTGGRITTQEQATQVVRGYCAKAIEARSACDIEVPGNKQATVALQNKAYQHWLMNYGSAVGALVCFHRTGLISDNAYDLLQQEVFATLASKVVGTINNPVPPYGGIVCT